ncbi:MAG: hypothetical protein OEZ34_12835 [Spirochaetia bacterium]|nr:hypothetical protein [Spirochaetia bacterium]
MTVSPVFLEALILVSIALCAVTPIVLAVLFFRDYKNKKLW